MNPISTNATSFKIKTSKTCNDDLNCWHDCHISFGEKKIVARLNDDQIWPILVALDKNGIRKLSRSKDNHYWKFSDKHVQEGELYLRALDDIKAQKGKIYKLNSDEFHLSSLTFG